MYQRLTWAVAVWAACAGAAWAWTTYQFDLPSQAPESLWRDALAAELHAKHEVVIEGGRIDVMTDTQAIELDWPHKWHEGLGQALHYADATGRKPVLAIISYSQAPEKMTRKTRERLEMVEKYCRKNGVEMMVLLPSHPSLYGKDKADDASAETPSTNLWLNTNTGVRHREGCRYFQSSLDGRACGADEGKPCRLCGGE